MLNIRHQERPAIRVLPIVQSDLLNLFFRVTCVLSEEASQPLGETKAAPIPGGRSLRFDPQCWRDFQSRLN